MAKKKSGQKVRRGYRKPREQVKIARERIEILFEMAEKEFNNGRQDLANRYVWLARKIATRFKIKINQKYYQRFCKKCLRYKKVGVNATVRLQDGFLIFKCDDCGYEWKKKIVK